MSNEINFRSDGSMDQTVNDWGKSFEAVEVDDDAIAFSTSAISITGEGGAADDLATIANGGTLKMLLITPADIDNPVTIKHAVGNIVTGGDDIVLDQPNMLVLLIYNGSLWVTLGLGLGGELSAGCFEHDFTSDDGDFETADFGSGIFGSWSSGNGWESTDNGVSVTQRIHIHKLFSEVVVTRLRIAYSVINAPVGNPSITVNIRLYKGGVQQFSDFETHPDNNTYVDDYPIDNIAADEIRIFTECSSYGDHTITSLIVDYLGADVFGTPNC